MINYIITFILGLLTGLLMSLICMVTLVYFKRIIEHKVTIIEKQIERVGPKPKGFLFDPLSEVESSREQIIEKNKKQGKDTPINELI